MIESILIGGIEIGENRPVVTIAEAAVEHLGSIEVAKRMVDAAKDAGADFIKFQLHLADSEMLPGSIKFWGGSMDEVLKRYNLSVNEHRELIGYCKTQGIQYLCTPFCAAAADILDDLGVPAFKIGSGEMTNIPMLRHIAKKKKPMIVSTGMATLKELEETVVALKAEETALILTNCTSIYPPKYHQINLGLIPKLKEKFDLLVGHSDHTPDIWTALGAVAMGAVVIEKHFTIDRRMKGPDYEVSLEPDEFKTMVEAIKKIEAAMGSEMGVYPEEEIVRNWAHHSVVSLKRIPSGAKITADMVGVKRPGNGIPAKELNSIVGCVAKNTITEDALIKWEDVKRSATNEFGDQK